MYPRLVLSKDSCPCSCCLVEVAAPHVYKLVLYLELGLKPNLVHNPSVASTVFKCGLFHHLFHPYYPLSYPYYKTKTSSINHPHCHTRVLRVKSLVHTLLPLVHCASCTIKGPGPEQCETSKIRTLTIRTGSLKGYRSKNRKLEVIISFRLEPQNHEALTVIFRQEENPFIWP